jgi:uncharacterized protein (TIGR01244 family)
VSLRWPAIVTLLAALELTACGSAPPPQHPTRPVSTEKLAPASCGSIERLNLCAGIYLASQPSAADFRKLRDQGLRTVINLRPESENKAFDEPALMSELGLRYVSIPFAGPEQLTDTVFTRARDMLEWADKPILIHCGTANRVGAIWLARRVLDDGLTYEAALAEAREIGLKAPDLESRARDYIERERTAGR